MTAGRPRNVTPSPEECIALGEDFVKWATEPTDEWRCLVGQWYSLKHGISKKIWKLLKQSPEFSPYYESAMVAMARKAIDGTMEKSFGQRYIRLYDTELVEEENAQAKFISDLKKDAEGAKLSTYNIVVSNDLAAGLNLPTSSLPNKPDSSTE